MENLGFISWLNWSVIWPVILILIGLNMLRKKGGDGCCSWLGEKEEEEKK